METKALERLDSFPYRHRIADVMSRPLATAEGSMRLEAAAKRMAEEKISSLVVLDQAARPQGIITERDVLRALAAAGEEAAGHSIGELMSAPVATVEAEAFIYVALGRMSRLGYRHLVAVDRQGRAVGMVTSRALLKLRAAETLQLGDELAAATSAQEMDAVRRQLSSLAEHLLSEGVAALGVAAVISAVYCEMTRRAGEIAQEEMSSDAAWGAAPARWCLLMLGSGGRGESLLKPDQDNALVHDGNEDADRWFAEFAHRVSDLLDASGIPYCKGDVMATNPIWRRSLAGWRAEIDHWIRSTAPETQLVVDIFYDFVPLLGDVALADELRLHATERARQSRLFLQRIAADIEDYNPPFGLFGGFKTDDGRIDLKLGGLLPLVSGARVMALKHGIPATSTAERLDGIAGAGAIKPEVAEHLKHSHETIARAVLEQQTIDLASDLPPSSKVDPQRLSAERIRELKEALHNVDSLKTLVRDVLAALDLD